jgi:hypothetical protein
MPVEHRAGGLKWDSAGRACRLFCPPRLAVPGELHPFSACGPASWPLGLCAAAATALPLAHPRRWFFDSRPSLQPGQPATSWRANSLLHFRTSHIPLLLPSNSSLSQHQDIERVRPERQHAVRKGTWHRPRTRLGFQGCLSRVETKGPRCLTRQFSSSQTRNYPDRPQLLSRAVPPTDLPNYLLSPSAEPDD